MRNNISASCLIEIADGVCPAETVFEPDKDIDPTADERGTEKDEGWGRRSGGSSNGSRDRSMEKRPSTECNLPKDVVERILAMVPFPYLFKVRTLSKAWYNKFPLPLESSGGPPTPKFLPKQKKKHKHSGSSSVSFQNLVSSVSTKWSVYCPVILGDEGLIGYDPLHKKWQGLITDLRQLLGTTSEPWLISSCGPLLCGVPQSANSQYDVLVTNVLTRRWRKLPSHPDSRIPSLLKLVSDASNTYKVFLVTEDPYKGPYDDHSLSDLNQQSRRYLCSQVFDSGNGTWSMSESDVPTATSFAWRSCCVYLNGNFYCLSGDDRNSVDHPLQVWVYNLEERSWTEIGHPFGQLVNLLTGRSVLFDLTRFQLFVCGSKVMVVLAMDPKEPYDHLVGTNTLFIFELDPETRIITEKSRGPPATVSANSEHMASDGTNIYFCTLDLLICYPAVVYNVNSGEWSCMAPDFKTARPLSNKRWADFSFQPGLNPFIAP